MSRSRLQLSFGTLGIVMVIATITLVGLVAFRFLDAQNNTQVVKAPETSTLKPESVPATINTSDDIDTITAQLDKLDLDALDGADLDAELDF